MRTRTITIAAALALCACLAMAKSASAHFIWLAPETSESGTVVQIYFGEDASPDDPELLKHVEGVQVWQLRRGQEPQPLKVERTDEALAAKLPDGRRRGGLVIAKHDLGVLNRGDAVFRLKYYAKGAPGRGLRAWSAVDASSHLPLDVVPTLSEGQIRVQVKFQGKPVEGAQIKASGPGLADFEATTDAGGIAQFSLAETGRYSIRARHIEATPGELDGKSYADVRHYTTATFDVPSRGPAAARRELQPLEQPVTSFGGTILDGHVYIYGGHTGDAHSYSKEEQGRHLRRLNLRTGAWESIAEGPHLQGLVLVAHGERLYRIGGFTAMNADGEDHDLRSQADVAAFDTRTKQWVELPPLPEPRSSFDAAVLGDTIYVVGGWNLQGDAENDWHETALALDLSADQPAWKELPQPPFQRRALAVAAHDGKIYAIGGMQAEGGPTTRVDVFDPETGEWTQGPSLLSPPRDDAGQEAESGRRRGDMTGFGASAFATGGALYVSTIDGSLQRLSADGSQWTVVDKTPTARFFHRMLPLDEGHFIMVGGANMSIGKFAEVEVISVK